MKTVDTILNHFGYTHDWLRIGVVTPSDLTGQMSEFETSDDKNKEHYRCGAFVRFLNGLEVMSDEMLDEILELTDDGSDGCDLRINRVIELVRSDLLTEQQLLRLREHPEYCDCRSVLKAVDREMLRRRVYSDGLTEDVFVSVREINDDVTLRMVLERDDLCRSHLEWIAEYGCNRAVRNLSKQMLQSRKYRNGGYRTSE